MDKQALHEELTGAFINYQWRLENPMPKPTDHDDAIRHYMSDSIFHNKVQSIVSGVMQIVSKHAD